VTIVNFLPRVSRIVPTLLTLVLAVSGVALADAPAGYYDSVDLSSPETARTTLHNLIDGHVRFPYTSSSTDTWDILEDADEYPVGSNTILDIYQNRLFTKFGGGNGPYNREHTWPNSYGFSSSGDTPYTDCHHLFLCDVEYNGYRGNRPFDDCASSCTAYVPDINDGAGGSGMPNLAGVNGGVLVWETWDSRKGDVARAMFYMDVRYAGDVSGEPDLVLTDNAALIQTTDGSPAYMGLLSTLLEWHAADPVDAKEMRHNDTVHSYQGNRNPFVDHPEWASYVFLGYMTPAEDELPAPAAPAARIAAIHPNPFNPSTSIDLELPAAGPVQVDIFGLDGRLVRTLLHETRPAGEVVLRWNGLDDNGLRVSSGPYFCRLRSGGATDTRKLLLLK
jgi:endonuclease I